MNNAASSMKEIHQFVLRLLAEDMSLDSGDVLAIADAMKTVEGEYIHLKSQFDQCRENNRHDVKTGLLKYDPGHLTTVIKRVVRYASGDSNPTFPVGLVRFDIDDFSLVNTDYGHEAGDEVLRAVAHFLTSHSRPTDKVIRFGGEEFDVLLPATNQRGVEKYLRKIFTALEDFNIKYNGRDISVTLSAGSSVKTCQLPLKSRISHATYEMLQKEMQEEADNALYESKFSGKNQYHHYDKLKQDYYHYCRKEYAASVCE